MEEKAMVVKTQSKSKKLFAAGKMAVFALATAIAFGPVQAKATDIDDLFAAADITTLSTNVKTYIIAFITLSVLFLGWKFYKRTTNRA